MGVGGEGDRRLGPVTVGRDLDGRSAVAMVLAGRGRIALRASFPSTGTLRKYLRGSMSSRTLVSLDS
jgi:hypothetical protein